MWTVGDEATHQRFLAALTKTHGYDGRVESWYNGEKIGDVEFADGSVKVTARSRERRSLELTVAERLWPMLPTDSLSPYGVWLRAYVTVTASATRFPEIPVFAGRLLGVERDRWSGSLKVTAADPMWQVNRQPFEELRSAPAGWSIVSTIFMLLTEVFPDATLEDQTGSVDAVPSGTAWDARAGSRGAAIDELAASIGAEVFALPTAVWPGGDFVIRPVPSLADSVVWVLPDGAQSIVAGDRMLQSGASVVNRWIVTGERTDGPLIRETVTDDDPTSPTRYGGPMGSLADFYSSPLFTSAAQARTAGLARLSRSVGIARSRAVQVVTCPALDAGDVLGIGVDGESPEYHIADDFTVPLQADPATMQIDTRSTGDNA